MNDIPETYPAGLYVLKTIPRQPRYNPTAASRKARIIAVFLAAAGALAVAPAAATTRGNAFFAEAAPTASRSLGLGAALRLLSSKLADTSATAGLASGMGLRKEITPNFRVDSAVQNLSSDLNLKLRLAVGAEFLTGPVAFRAGFASTGEDKGLSLGTGFAAGGWLINYDIGLANSLESRQRIRVGFQFGTDRP